MLNPRATGVTNGFSWSTAYRTIPEALERSSAGDEVWVAEGVYEAFWESPPITIPDNVSVYGGFAGIETNRTQRDWMRRKSILTRYDDLWFWYRIGHVTSLASLGAGSRLDGFTLVKGYAPYASGVYVGGPGAIVANNTIVSNQTTGVFGGAGVFIDTPMRFPAMGAEEFFHYYADAFLRMHFPFGVTNIPVYPTNHYSPSLHRLLQVAANLYDAQHTDPLPSVFRPRFERDSNGRIIIVGYYLDNDPATLDTWRETNPHNIHW